tara:strand:+ start:104 stop:316 length:213 start_codon:yes stop_codon:yes gene_type:complete
VHVVAVPPAPTELAGQSSHESPSQYLPEAQFATQTLVVSAALSPKIVEPVFDEPAGHTVHVSTVVVYFVA